MEKATIGLIDGDNFNHTDIVSTGAKLSLEALESLDFTVLNRVNARDRRFVICSSTKAAHLIVDGKIAGTMRVTIDLSPSWYFEQQHKIRQAKSGDSDE